MGVVTCQTLNSSVSCVLAVSESNGAAYQLRKILDRSDPEAPTPLHVPALRPYLEQTVQLWFPNLSKYQISV